jgi:predicted RNase H-related nuclease YkuK (DUF458 family)
MKYEKKNRIFIYIIVLLAVLLFGTTVFYTNKLDEAGRLNDQLTERLSDATDTNRRLAETVEQCQFIVTELGNTTDRSIGTVREAIDVIEETREAVGALEVELGIWDSDSVYDRIDDYVFNNELKQ